MSRSPSLGCTLPPPSSTTKLSHFSTISVSGKDSQQPHKTSSTSSSANKSFSSLSVFHNASGQNPDRICFPGTREDILETIQRWIDNPTVERVAWFYGPVGSGKSTISQTVAHVNTPNKVAATFFFQSDPSRNAGNRLFIALALQLGFSIPAIKDVIFHSLNKLSDLPTRDVETQFEELIFRPLMALNEGTSAVRHQAPVIIIDGIDGCLDDSLQQRILDIIGTAVRKTNFPLRFFISSRPEAHIEETINRFGSHILRVDLATVHDVNNDIGHYLSREFARIANERSIDPTWPGQQTVQHLVSKSAGQFLYATNVIRHVGDENESPQTQLDIILGLKPPRIRPPFAELDRLFREILNRVRDQDFLKAFLVLLVVRQSISRDSLSDDYALLMEISRAELGGKLRRMRSILKFEPSIGVHYPSFLEFLQDWSRSYQYHVNKNVGTRRYVELMTDSLIRRAARLTEQPNFHGSDHFAPEFGALIHRNPRGIELDIGDWEQTLRPLWNVLVKLLGSSKMGSLKVGYCQECQFFQISYNILTHLKSLGEREDPDIEKCLNSLKEIIRYGSEQQNLGMNFGRHMFDSAAIAGIMVAVLANQR